MDSCHATSETSTSILTAESTSSDLRAFRQDVLRGLKSFPKRIPSKYLYDARGSRLFDQICELDEYYPTRIESQLMQQHGAKMARCLGNEIVLVELGSGSSEKTRILLNHLNDLAAYLPVDISASHLHQAARGIKAAYPEVDVHPLVADFMDSVSLPSRYRGRSVCTYFPGSTIGNLERDEASRLLRNIRAMSGQRGGLLVGFDLQKDAGVLHRAYNDSKGITAAFNLNVLSRMNRELNGNFDLSQFNHLAFYNADDERIEIYIESRCDQTAVVAGREFSFCTGERILTEYSHKYTIDGFASLAQDAGLLMRNVWTDDRRWFAVAYLNTSGRD